MALVCATSDNLQAQEDDGEDLEQEEDPAACDPPTPAPAPAAALPNAEPGFASLISPGYAAQVSHEYAAAGAVAPPLPPPPASTSLNARGRPRRQVAVNEKVKYKDFYLKEEEDDEKDDGVDYSRYNHHTTLVVVTPALVMQWFHEIEKITGTSLVYEFFDHQTREFHSRGRRRRNGQCGGGKVDVVVTTYNAFDTKKNQKRKRGKHSATILKSILWRRVVLDEMQEIRSDKSSIAKNIGDLCCDRRWMVSGSPLFEGLDDLRGELAFLSLTPFGGNVEDGYWDFAIRQPFDAKHPQAIELLLSLGQVLLRREKSTRVIKTGATILDLEQFSLEYSRVRQNDDERALYCGLEYLNHACSEGEGIAKEKPLFLRLMQQACTSPALLLPHLTDINNLWRKIHRKAHAALPQSAVLSCGDAIKFLSQVEDLAKTDSDFVTDQTFGNRGASNRNRALESVETRRKEAADKLSRAMAEVEKHTSMRAKAVSHHHLFVVVCWKNVLLTFSLCSLFFFFSFLFSAMAPTVGESDVWTSRSKLHAPSQHRTSQQWEGKGFFQIHELMGVEILDSRSHSRGRTRSCKFPRDIGTRMETGGFLLQNERRQP